MTRISREVRLVSKPVGLPKPEHFVVTETPLPVPKDGEVLVRNHYFQVFPAMLRTMIGGGTEIHPTLLPGDTLLGPAVGEVVSAPAGSPLRTGELVSHWLGWREYAAVPAEACAPLGDTLSDPVAHLSQGWTAYGALTRAARMRSGDTVFVTGGATAVGVMAGQIARLLGAGRVIGTTGSPEKAARMVAELGYDAALLRGAEPIADQLAKAAPEGIDVLLDTVGGDHLEAAVAAARPEARLVLVGALAAQLSPEDIGTTVPPVTFDASLLIIRRIQMLGFVAQDHPDALPEWIERFDGWLRSGAITFPHVRVAGIERAIQTLQETIDGRHLGTVIVDAYGRADADR
ncbi:MDR family NADP-dependent oxidoreductase [Nonomuraea sp. NPDC049714]|uniref:MDR family NADP-dependent oxidoreductase n=1 Tax=Nonomuraea sp. NPDC049714 TaxID=3364357 RepID=UPI00379F8FB4